MDDQGQEKKNRTNGMVPELFHTILQRPSFPQILLTSYLNIN